VRLTRPLEPQVQPSHQALVSEEKIVGPSDGRAVELLYREQLCAVAGAGLS